MTDGVESLGRAVVSRLVAARDPRKAASPGAAPLPNRGDAPQSLPRFPFSLRERRRAALEIRADYERDTGEDEDDEWFEWGSVRW